MYSWKISTKVILAIIWITWIWIWWWYYYYDNYYNKEDQLNESEEKKEKILSKEERKEIAEKAYKERIEENKKEENKQLKKIIALKLKEYKKKHKKYPIPDKAKKKQNWKQAIIYWHIWTGVSKKLWFKRVPINPETEKHYRYIINEKQDKFKIIE